MKKVLSILMILVLALGTCMAFAGCGGTGEENNAQNDNATKAPNVTPTGQAATVGTVAPEDIVTEVKVGFIFLHDENSTYDKNFMDAARSIAEGKVDLSKLVTHEFALEDADKAFELGAHPTDDVVKIVVKMS